MPQIDREQLERYAEKIYDRYEYFNQYTLETIGRRIKATGELSAADQQALKNISDISGDMQAITKKLAEITELNISEIEAIYEQVAKDGVNTYRPLFDFKGMRFVPFEENDFAKQLVRNWAKETAGTMINLSRTKALCFDRYDLAGNVVGSVPLEGTFEQAISEAVAAVSSGSVDFSTAMARTVERLGGSGVKVNYGNGVNRSLSAMARQNILYGAKQSAQAYDEYIGKELGCDGFEVDAHSGCRPSHMFMQGKMYSYSGRKRIGGVTYEDGSEALERLKDYGCLHFKTDVILGVSVPRYSAAELKRIHRETTELIEYNDKEKTLYEWKQTQRRFERAVRNEQQKADMFTAAGMKRKAEDCKDRIKAYRNTYEDMCNNVKGLELRLDRMKNVKGVDISGKSGIIKESAKKNITHITAKAIENVPKVKISGYSDEQCNFIQQQHKELLKYAKDNNDSKEAAFVFRKGLTDRTEYIGTDDSLDFGTALLSKGNGLFIMHNHPRNSGFSTSDIEFFVMNNSVTNMSVVKNNSRVSILTKTDSFDSLTLKKEYDRLYRKIVKNNTDAEKSKFVEKLLLKTRSGVILNEK